MAALNATEIELTAKFRQRLTDLNLTGEQSTDAFLIRWLRARELNLDQSEKMLRAHFVWVKENDMENILSWTLPSDFHKELAHLLTGRDLDNSPVLYLQFGKWDLKKLVQQGHKKNICRFFDQLWCRTIDAMRGHFTPIDHHSVSQCVLVSDVTNLSVSFLTSRGAIEAVLNMVRSFEANYPELLKRVYVINASRIFTMIYSLVKPLMSQRTIDKFRIYSNDSWRKDLAEVIPIHHIPILYGGTNTESFDGSPFIPPSEDREIEINEELEKDENITLYIDSGQIINLEFEVDNPESSLSWVVQVEEGQIDFHVKVEGKEVSRMNKLRVKGEALEGSLTCQKKDSVKLYFDKSNWNVSSVVKYRVDLFGGDL